MFDDQQLAWLARIDPQLLNPVQQRGADTKQTRLAFVLVIEGPYRFRVDRDVGAYLGLTLASKQTGAAVPRQRIAKHGDKLLRRLLAWSAL